MFEMSGISGLIGQVSATSLEPSGVTAVLSVLFGVAVGFALGLTGGGGSIFAVPMLVYGLGMPAHEAPAVSLAAVGATAAFGLAHRLRAGEVEIGTGLIFSVGGILGTPVGAWIGRQMPAGLLLLCFAALMTLVAVRMWRKASQSSRTGQTGEERAMLEPAPADESGAICRRDPSGRLRLSSQCGALLVAVGLGTGVLAGIFGVGGGFVIVPALVFFSGMGIHRAVATSLLAITLIGASGLVSNVAAGRMPPMDVTALFVVGGIAGMLLGTRLGRRLSGPKLQQLFSVAILAVAAFIVFRNVAG